MSPFTAGVIVGVVAGLAAGALAVLIYLAVKAMGLIQKTWWR